MTSPPGFRTETWRSETPMANETEPAFVTRRELYPVLSSVYLLIAFALLGLAPLRDHRMATVVGYVLLFAATMGLISAFKMLGSDSANVRRRRIVVLSKKPTSQNRRGGT